MVNPTTWIAKVMPEMDYLEINELQFIKVRNCPFLYKRRSILSGGGGVICSLRRKIILCKES